MGGPALLVWAQAENPGLFVLDFNQTAAPDRRGRGNMAEIAFEVILIILLIIGNGVFALSETAIISSRRARLQERAEQGDAGARIALEVAREPSRFLSTVQIGITLVGIFAGAYGGATLAEAIAAGLQGFPRLAPYGEAIGLAVVVIGVTYLSLVVGELAPKRLALANPEAMAARVARPMRALSKLAAPVVKVLTASTSLLLRLLGVRASTDPLVTVEEIRIMVEQGASAGVFEEAEHDIVTSALNLDEKRVGRVMTPRTEIAWVDLDEPLEKIRGLILGSTHAYFPAGRGNLDNVDGLLRAREFLAQLVGGQPMDWDSLLQPPLFVPESQTILDLLQLLRTTGQPLALIIDEFGGLQGMVTLTDIVEALVGDIHQPDETEEPEVVQRDDGSWLLDGRLPIDHVKTLLSMRDLPDETEAGYDTLGGMVMTVLGVVPAIGQHFDYGGWCFEVVDMDGHRVDRVLVYPDAVEKPAET